MSARAARRRTPLAVRVFFLLAALPFFFVFPYIYTLNNPNENVRTYMTMALVEEGTFRIDRIVARYGWVNDMASVPQPDGTRRLYSVKAPATSFAGVPVYWAMTKIAPLFHVPVPHDRTEPSAKVAWMRATTWVLRLVAVQLPCFVFLILFERYLRDFTADVPIRLAAVAAAGLGSNFLAYAQMFASHALFAVAAFGAFAVTERNLRLVRDPRRRPPSCGFLAGFFAGWATLLEYHALPVSLVLALYAAWTFRRPLRLAAVAAGGAIHVAAMMLFQWRAYGNPLTPGHKMVETQAFAEEHHHGLFGITAPNWEAFENLSMHPGFGFFGMSPFMWLGLAALPLGLVVGFGPPRLRRLRRAATLVWFVAMTLMFLLMSSALQWRGGWTLGTRYFGAAPPFFAFGAVCALEHVASHGSRARAVARGVAAGAALASVLGCGLVALVFNTLPPTGIPRPLPEFALPLARAGFVPHHIGEWFGWQSPLLWYVCAFALIATTLVAAWWPAGEAWPTYGVRLAAGVASAAIALAPIVSKPPPDEAVAPALTMWTSMWEPSARDRITRAREEAERFGSARPCLWHRVADLARIVEDEGLAKAAMARAGVARTECPR